MLIVTRQKLFSLSVNTLQLDDTTVPISDSVKSLGVLLDSTLSMENFISQTSKSCYYQLRRISSVRKYLSTEATVKLVTSLILSTPRLLQFSPFWPACFLCPKPSLHIEQQCCSPHTEKKRKTDHITPLFQFLHWLPIQQRIQYRINSLCYKFITGTAPSYLCDCLQLYTPSRTLRSSSDILSLQIPRTTLSAVGSRAYLE